MGFVPCFRNDIFLSGKVTAFNCRVLLLLGSLPFSHNELYLIRPCNHLNITAINDIQPCKKKTFFTICCWWIHQCSVQFNLLIYKVVQGMHRTPQAILDPENSHCHLNPAAPKCRRFECLVRLRWWWDSFLQVSCDSDESQQVRGAFASGLRERCKEC